jgi:hypothetical protein
MPLRKNTPRVISLRGRKTFGVKERAKRACTNNIPPFFILSESQRAVAPPRNGNAYSIGLVA